MKKLFFLLFCISASTALAQQKLKFETNERTDGTVFYALDESSSQLYYMLDYGQNSGNWKAYGGTVDVKNTSFDFEATERTDGSAFFSLDTKTGQLYYMLDYGQSSGKWKAYGSKVDESGKSNFTLRVNERKEGTAFFVIESTTGQMYYMLDYGQNSGNWKKYGNTISK